MLPMLYAALPATVKRAARTRFAPALRGGAR